MSIAAVLTNYIRFSGDQELELVFNSGELADSPNLQQLVTLAVGNNTIEVPDIEDFTVHGLAIIPPSLNEVDIVLKGADADTGISLNPTGVTVVQFGTAPASLVLSVDEAVVGIRLVWF